MHFGRASLGGSWKPLGGRWGVFINIMIRTVIILIMIVLIIMNITINTIVIYIIIITLVVPSARCSRRGLREY